MRRYCCLLVFFLHLSCAEKNRTDENSTAVRKEIKITIDNYYNDIRKEGLLAEFKYLDSSGQFFWVPPGYLNYAGYDSITAAIRRNAAFIKWIDNGYDSLLIIPLTSEHAQFAMRTRSTIVNSAGDTSRIHFIESGVMVKRKDGWKFLSGQTSLLK